VLKRLFKSNLYFLIPYLLFLFTGAILLLVYSKSELHLHFNSFHKVLFNHFFYLLTFLGDGWTAIIISIILLFFSYRFALITVLSFALGSGITQSLKHFVFNNHVRPVKFFEGNRLLYLIPGVDMNSYYSFPSGHSTTAFAVYFCLALFVSRKWMKFGLLVLTLLIAYSRVYLSQHFFVDVYAGSMVGIFSTICVWLLFQRYMKTQVLDRSLLRQGHS
jgi:membrane-associated phospholipid phosphatase